MTHTLLLVFIHGFKGDDNTFQKFPEHIRVLLSDALPNIEVKSLMYPTYETRGELNACVASFRQWLQDKVIDLEVDARTPSPTLDPSVHVLLCGHSMGGIVAAETLLSIARDQAVPHRTATPPPDVGNSTTSAPPKSAKRQAAKLSIPDHQERASSAPPGKSGPRKLRTATPSSEPADATPAALFPRVQGILAFDTPYLGIHPGVVAHGAEAHFNNAQAAWNAYNQASRLFGAGSATAPAANAAANASKSGSNWLMLAGGAAALAAAGGAAWMGRDQIMSAAQWATGHLEFVGCLARGAELSQRLDAVVKLIDRCNIGFADFYSKLDDSHGKAQNYAGQLVGQERTFCIVPSDVKAASDPGSPNKRRKVEADKKAKKGDWVACVNKQVDNEISAHRCMFTPEYNSGYYKMCDRARETVKSWVDQEWYDKSEPKEAEEEADDGADDEGGEEEAKV